jgi:hypothetical protein
MKEDRHSGLSVVAAARQPGWGACVESSAAPSDSEDPSGIRQNQKRPYRKPSYRYERVFETMALACGKISPVEFQCRFNRKNS